MYILVPAQSVTGSAWLETAVGALECIGLSVNGTIDGPLFRPPADMATQTLCMRAVTSREVSLCLQQILGPDEVAEHTTSHSLKATPLSWVSKADFDRDTSAVLGRQDVVHIRGCVQP